MVGSWLVVTASIVDVLVDLPVSKSATDAFARNRLAAIGTAKESPGKGKIWCANSPVPAIHDRLAGVKSRPVDQALIFALKDMAVAMKFADVETVAEYP